MSGVSHVRGGGRALQPRATPCHAEDAAPQWYVLPMTPSIMCKRTIGGVLLMQHRLESVPLARASRPRTCTHSHTPRCARRLVPRDQIGDSMFVVGGAARTGDHFDDVHKFDLRAGKWVPVTVTGAKPPKMSGHSAVAFGDKLVVFGGMNMEAQEMYNDVWVLHTGA